MAQIPRSALGLGLAGLLPFVWGSYSHFAGIEGPYTGLPLLRTYATIILAFMSGVIWGFAAKANGRVADAGYVMAVLPAIYAIALHAAPARPAIGGLLFGFIVLIGVDYWASRMGLAPAWWMRLRLILTAGVTLCLLPAALS